MSDRWTVVLAVGVALGAWHHPRLSLVLGLVLAVVGFGMRSPVVLVGAGFVLAAALGTRAVDGLAPVAPSSFRGTVTLLADPTETPYGVRVDVRVGHRRVELEASGSAAGAITASLAGERLRVDGRLGPPPPDAPWLVPRHIVGRLRASHAERVDAGSAPWRAANRVRRVLARGALALPRDDEALYGGFVLGDDRGQSPEVVDDFRGAGLSHLLVVSGQNVAFLLVVLGPLIRRLDLAGRWVLTLGVVGAFGVLTRFEPSVLRASAMVAISVTATWAGRPTSTVRLVALAVTVLVLIDPLLVRSVGFQLSVAASVGIAVLARPIADRIPGPEWWREALAVTVAAQLGVAPVLVPRFGGLPVVSVPANLLAVPVGGLVTTWGLPAGLVAGLGGPDVARVLHVPTHLFIGWVGAVARVGASLPLGELGAPHLIALVALALVAVAGPRWHPRSWPRARWGVAALAVGIAVQPAVALRSPPVDQPVAGGSHLYRSGGATVLVLGGRPRAGPLLEDLRRAGVRRVDLVVADGDPPADVVRALRHRWPVGGSFDSSTGGGVRVGGLEIHVGLGADGVLVTARGR